MWKTPEIAKVAASIGATQAAFQNCLSSAKTIEEAQENLEQLKKRIKKGYHEKSLELHPDRTGGNKDKEEQFKLLSSVYRTTQNFKVEPRRPAVTRVAVVSCYWNTNTSTATNF